MRPKAELSIDSDTADDALLILDPPLLGIWAVDVELDEIELLEEDSKVDTDDIDELVTVDDEFVASVIVNWITSTIQRNPRSIVV